MGDEHDGGLGFQPDLLNQPVHFLTGKGIERAKGFIHQQNLRAQRQGADHGGALLHAAGQFAGKALLEPCQPDAVHQMVDPAAVWRDPLDLEREQDVVDQGAPGQQVRLLKHQTDIGMGAGDRLAIERYGARGQAVQTRHRPQERGLAAARRADDGRDGVGRDIETAARQGIQRTIALGGILNPELDRHARRAFCRWNLVGKECF